MAKERKKKASYSCAPCKRLKIKCDHKVPCSNCVRNNRQQECCNAPAKSLTQFKELIQPNPVFGRISKSASKKQDTAITSSSSSYLFPIEKRFGSSISSVESDSRASTGISPHSSFSRGYVPLSDMNVMAQQVPTSTITNMIEDLHRQLSEKSAALDMTIQQNIALINHNEDMKRELEYFSRINAPIQSSNFPKNDPDGGYVNIESFKRRMLELLPNYELVMFLKNHYMLNLNHQSIIHAETFDIDLQAFYHCLSPVGSIDDIDLYWISLLFMILSVSLISSLNTSALMSSQLRSQFESQSQQPSMKKSLLWFNTSKEIIKFIECSNPPIPSTPISGLLSLQIQVLGMSYCQYTKNLKLLDTILSQSINDLHTQKLHLLSTYQKPTIQTELQKRIYWAVAGIDTLRSFPMQRFPMIAHKSVIPSPSNLNDHSLSEGKCLSIDLTIPTNNSFEILKINFMRKLNQLQFDRIETGRGDYGEVFPKLMKFDTAYCQEFINLPWYAKLDKENHFPVGLSTRLFFPIINLNLFYCITRFKTLQKFLGHSLPYVDQVCSAVVKSVLVPYKTLKQIIPLNADPSFWIQFIADLNQSLVGAIMVQLLYLVKVKGITKEKKSSISSDIDGLIEDMVYLEKKSFVRTRIIKENLRVFEVLRKYIRNSVYSPRLSDTEVSEKMKVHALVNDPSASPREPKLIESIDDLHDKQTIDHSCDIVKKLVSQQPQVLNKYEDEIMNDLKKLGLTDVDIEEFGLRGY